LVFTFRLTIFVSFLELHHIRQITLRIFREPIMSIRDNDTQNRAVTLREFQQLDSTIFVDSGDELAAAKLGSVSNRSAESVEDAADLPWSAIQNQLEVRMVIPFYPMGMGVAKSVKEAAFDLAAMVTDSAIGDIVDDPVRSCHFQAPLE
jgi:hypothetical protein